MRILKALIATCLLAASSSFAAPVEYDAPDFHLIVCRPFDSWSGDNKVMEGERETIASHRGRVAYRPSADRPTVLGAGLTLLNGPTDDSITADTMAILKSRGVEISSRGSYHWVLGPAVTLDSASYPLLQRAQTSLYEALIRKQGDPDKLSDSFAARRILGNVLAIVAIGAGVDKFGGTGGYVVTAAFAGDISQLPLGVRQSFAPFNLPALDATQFTAIDVYPVKVNEGGSPGQVVIAYKANLTDAVRHDALVQALASIAGSDTTPAAIDAARAADFAHRRDVWNACLSAHECGPEAHAEANK